MKKEKTILILFMVPLFISTSFFKTDRKKSTLTSHEVEFTFIGNVALYGTPKDCGIFSPDTVTLKGLLTGDENFKATAENYEPVEYRGVLQLNIKMAVCNVRRDKNGEDKWCIMTVTGNGPVNTELQIDTVAGYGYIKIEYDSTSSKLANFGKFKKRVYGTCDPGEMKEEEDINVPNNTIAAIFNGHELRCLKNSPILHKGRYPPESGPDGTIIIEVKN